MKYQIITFYEFKDLTKIGELEEIKESLKRSMRENSVFGTIILAAEGFNSTVCGEAETIEKFIREAENILKTTLKYKSSLHAEIPFRRVHVKIKPEIVSLKQKIEIEKGTGTHVSPQNWNEIINDAETIVLDARNDYEVQSRHISRSGQSANPKNSAICRSLSKKISTRKT